MDEHRVVLTWLTVSSVVLFVASLIAMPALVVRIPPGYFSQHRRPPSRWAHRHPIVRTALGIGKNALGCVFIVAGIAMLVLPGQGLLSILIGLLLLDIPGKYRFEKWLVSRRRIAAAINWLRKRSGQPPLEVEHGPRAGA